MSKYSEDPHGCEPCGPSKVGLLCGNDLEANPQNHYSQGRLAGYRDPVQLSRAAIANAAIGGQIGGRAGVVLVRLGAIFALRALASGSAQ